jgi:hypothetical protein
MYFDHIRNSNEPLLQNMIRDQMKGLSENEHPFLHQAVEHMPPTCETISEYLYSANLLNAVQEQLYSRFKQIDPHDYNWISDELLEQCYQTLDRVLKPDCTGDWAPEKFIVQSSNEIDHVDIDRCLASVLKESNMTYRFSARADLLTPTSLWELKCTGQLTLDHKLQLVIYAWLYRMKWSGKKDVDSMKYYLYNIKTNELLQLHASLDELTTIVCEIIRNKYMTHTELTDEEFQAQFETIHNLGHSERESKSESEEDDEMTWPTFSSTTTV